MKRQRRSRIIIKTLPFVISRRVIIIIIIIKSVRQAVTIAFFLKFRSAASRFFQKVKFPAFDVFDRFYKMFFKSRLALNFFVWLYYIIKCII